MKLTVDLAAKFSAAVVLDRSDRVCHQFDSLGRSSFEFAEEISQTALDWEVTDVILEDVPYGVSGQAQVKSVFRLQGIVIHELGGADLLESTFFLNPSTWQSTYTGVARAPKGLKGKAAADYRYAAARAHALELGYTPPNLVQTYIDGLPEGTRVLKKHTDALLKSETDYIDAFLIGHWANSIDTQENLRAYMQVPLI